MILTKSLPSRYVFVFGSNLAGYHGAGAALFARTHFGAVKGIGNGRQGNSYAIPTKDSRLCSLDPDVINESLRAFKYYARANPDTCFLLTPVGTGLAGIDPSKLELTNDLPGNVVYLPDLG
jgi:hypothetical protein